MLTCILFFWKNTIEFGLAVFFCMELLLNLAWSLLVLPGYWLWRRSTHSRVAHHVNARQCLLALGCTLVLLFPVISATDDLHAMRAEMEESSPGKRAVRLAGEKHSPAIHRLQGSPVLAGIADWLPAPESVWLQVLSSSPASLSSRWTWHVGRAPPASFLA
jgi:hypothetical protein